MKILGYIETCLFQVNREQFKYPNLLEKLYIITKTN